MYCSKCGELNPEGSDYCKKCGAPLSHAAIPPAAQPPAAPASGQQATMPARPTSGFSTASLILGILGFSGICALLAIIFGAIGINQEKRTGAGGKGMAIAGVVLGSVWIFLGIITILIFVAIGLSAFS